MTKPVSPPPAPFALKKLTANLIVEEIEPCLAFWVDRLGFEKTVEVAEDPAAAAQGGAAKLGFVILVKGGVELMLQSRASLAGDVAAIAGGAYRSVLFLEVPALEPVRQALAGWPMIVEGRRTFYGTDELIVEDPAGNRVFFAAHA
jgi:catechol 2,3-dioxygenase-like lactoylglutathione lyase family enzyme